MEWLVRWREWNKRNELVTKEKAFESDAKRQKYTAKLSDKDNFHEFLAWSDPENTVH